jgi:hypothetical protein
VDTLGNVMPSEQYSQGYRGKPRNSAFGPAAGKETLSHSFNSGYRPTAPLATDDPFTWFPWRPQEEERKGEEPEHPAPQEPQQCRAGTGTAYAAALEPLAPALAAG